MRIRKAWWLLTGFLIVGCATSRVVYPVTMDCRALRMAPVTNQDQRLEFASQGFSVLPPPGEHWCIVGSGSQSAAFATSPLIGSRLEAAPSPAAMRHTFGVMVTAVEQHEAKIDTPEALRAFAERWIRSDEPRFKIVEIQVVPDSSLNVECVLMEWVAEERDNPGARGVVLVMVNRLNLLCRHPHAAPPSLVWIGASERYQQGEMGGPLLIDVRKEQVETFVHSLRFSPPR